MTDPLYQGSNVGDLVVTAGYSGRQGRLTLEYTVKVWDVRGAPRMLAGLPFAAGPAMLATPPDLKHTLCDATVLVRLGPVGLGSAPQQLEQLERVERAVSAVEGVGEGVWHPVGGQRE